MRDGLTLRERRIMRLWDDGRSIQQIANKLELPVTLVRTKIAAFHIGNEYPDEVRNVTLGSATLLAAINAARAITPQLGA
jgi:hypothetical protein